MFVTWLVSSSGTLVNYEHPANMEFMPVTWLVSSAGMLPNDEQLLNKYRMFVTWLVSSSGTLVNDEQNWNSPCSDGPTTSIGTVISVMVW